MKKTAIPSTPAAERLIRLSENQRFVLAACEEGDPMRGCHGFSAHGAREMTFLSLRRKGLLTLTFEVTEEGRRYLPKSTHKPLLS